MANIRGFEFPDHLHYLMQHDTWARRDSDGDVTIGLTSLGCHISGTFMEFLAKPVESVIERDRALGMLEMSKVLRAARSPVTGTVVEINDKARSAPTLINADPYGEGWLLRMRPHAWDVECAMLVTGDEIPGAVDAYMALLAESFG
jgi:glycine cleavage system H protein